MLLLLSAAIVGAAIWWAARQVTGELRCARDESARARALTVAQMFAPGITAAHADPRALLVWQPLAKATRQLFPAEFATLDGVSGGAFPFTKDQIQAAHSEWTANWLAWERSHDHEYKLKAAAAEHELAASGGSPIMRARLEAVEREKLDLYQRRYQDYVRVAKALQALAS
jgi:hypothetical protein